MSVRLIARELYRLIGLIERLQIEIERASPENREELTEQLRKAKAERDYLRRALDGGKDRA